MKLFRKAMLAVVTFVLALVAFVAPVRNNNVDAADTMRVYYTNPSNWTTVKAYGWNGSFAPSWPGTNMTKDVETGYWYIDGITPGQMIIFNNGSKSQTGDLKVPTDGACVSNGSSWTMLDEAPEEIETITVYYANPYKWTKVNAFGWASPSGAGLQNTWPGTAMKLDEEKGMYYIEGVEPGQKIIFNNGSSQTADLTVPTDGACVYSGTAWTALDEEIVEPVAITVWFDNSTKKWSKVNAYIWDAGNTPLNGAWPGKAMTLDPVSGHYYVENVMQGSNIIFNDGKNQTSDLVVPVDGKNICNGSTWASFEPVEWELEVAVGFQVGTKDEAKALRLVAELNLNERMLETFESTIAFRVTHNGIADERAVTRLYSSVNPMNGEAELTGAYYAVLTYVNVPAGEYTVEVLVDGEVAATVVATVA